MRRVAQKAVGNGALAAARSMPLTAFLLVYVATCWLGGVALLFGPGGVRDSYVYSSGARIGHLSSHEVATAMLLLTAAPILLAAGWWIAGRATRRFAGSAPGQSLAGAPPPRALTAVMGITLAYLLLRLSLLGAPGHLGAWFSYGEFIQQRNRTFDALTFADFVLAYSVAPLLVGAYLAARIGDGTPARAAIKIGTALLATLFAISMLLYQKRPLFAYLLIVGAIVLLHAPARARLGGLTSRRLVRPAILVAIGAYAVYLALLVAPVLRSNLGAEATGPTPVALWTFEEGDRGWNPVGPFINQGADTADADGAHGRALAFTAGRPQQGVSIETGVAGTATSVWHLSASVRSDQAATASLLVGATARDYATRSVVTGPEWTPIDVEWLERSDTPSVVVAARGEEAASYAIDDVILYRTYTADGSGPGHRAVISQSRFDAGFSGWVSSGPARLRTATGEAGLGMRVVAPSPAAGAVLRMRAPLRGGTTVRAALSLRSDRRTPVTVSFKGAGEDGSARVVPDRRWRTTTVRWTPATDVAEPTLRLQARQSGSFDVDEVTVSRRGKPVPTTSEPSSKPAPPEQPSGVTFPRNEDLAGRSRGTALLFYALLAPFTRTAGPAVAYPSIFPERHSYFPIDLGLDVLGIGTAPNDNQVSFDLMYPDSLPGQNSVAFPFTLYSQGGVLVALFGALLLGVLWRLVWWVSQARIGAPLARACVGGFVILVGVFLAGDSARNSMLASYGIVWPLLGVGAGMAAFRLAPRLKVPRVR